MSKWPFNQVKKQPLSKKRIILIIAVIITVLAIGSVVAWCLLGSKNSSNENKNTATDIVDYQKASSEIEATGNSAEDISKLVANYGAQYEADLGNIQYSDPSKWDTDMVNKAHLVLLYADKIAAYSQIETVYYLIESAKSSGVNVNENSMNVNDARREAIFAKIPPFSGPASTTEVTENEF